MRRGRENLFEELGRVEGEHSNKNRRAEVSRIHGELNKGYAKGGRAAFKLGSKPRDKQTPSIGRSKGPKQSIQRTPRPKWKDRKPIRRRLPVGAEGIFGLGVKGKPHSSPEGRKATSKLAIQRLQDRRMKEKTPRDNLRDKLKDLDKGRLVPDPRHKPGPQKPIDPRSPYIKDRVMTPLRAKKAVGGAVKAGKRFLDFIKTGKHVDKHGVKTNVAKAAERLTGKPHVDHGKRKRIKHLGKGKASGGRIGLKHGSAQSHYLQHGYGPTKTRLRTGKPKIAIKGWS